MIKQFIAWLHLITTPKPVIDKHRIDDGNLLAEVRERIDQLYQDIEHERRIKGKL